jgi:hypothetical protein
MEQQYLAQEEEADQEDPAEPDEQVLDAPSPHPGQRAHAHLKRAEDADGHHDLGDHRADTRVL